ncbi:DNA-binding protein [Mergibacter septicus]|uniref:DUF1804 family protein n=1 Tax=Mergibacter septicus TaxID=221402 RepID=UPI001178EAB1|nr:DUF1804 family protein [Mergibacter septicus]AWX14263.1 DNA-binding protein [Mergibacter septicus]
MAHDGKTRKAVRSAYVFDYYTLEQAAERAGVSFATARRWKKQAAETGDDWDKVRDANTAASGKIEDVSKGLLTTFVLHFGTVIEEVKTNQELDTKAKAALLSGLGDSFTKIVSASKKILPEVSQLEIAMRTVKMFGERVKNERPDLLPVFLDLLERFAEDLQEEFS